MAEADDQGIGDLDTILGLHIRMAHGAVRRHFSETFVDLGLSQKQVSVLWLAADHPGIGQSELARRLQMDRATAMAIVHTLEKRGLLERTPVAADARRIALSVSKTGADILVRARAAITAHEAWLKERFTSEEITQFITLLRRIHAGQKASDPN
jgi:DNA-binding MarR family transcriptional regulator